MNKSRSGSQVMFGLIGMIRPLLAVMFVAILMGSIGNLMAIFITVLGGVGIGNVLGIDKTMPLTTVFVRQLFLPYCAEYCVMRNRRAIIILRLNYWQVSVIRFFRRCVN